MRKWTATLLIIALLLTLCGCGKEDESYIHAVEFYYLRGDISYGQADGVIASETREAGHGNDLNHILTLYLQGPVSEGLVSPFPVGTVLTEVRTEDTTICVTLGGSFAELTGMDLTIACAGLAKTCLAISDTDTVRIVIQDGLWDDETEIVLTESDLLFLDDSTEEIS